MATEQTFNKAHNEVASAVARGDLRPGPCEQAGPECFGRVLAHHDDYAKPLEVRWLCGRHHGRWHHEHGPGLNRYDTPRCVVCGDAGCEFCPDVLERDARRVSVTSLLELERRARDNGRDRRGGLELEPDEAVLVRRELVELARRQERLDGLSSSSSPAWDEAGSVELRLVLVLAGVLAAAVLVWLAWPYLVGAGVMVAAFRHLTRHTRRRRPRSSWSSLGRTAAMMYAAWNSRGLVHRNGRPLRVSVPTSVGRQHVDEYGEIPF